VCPWVSEPQALCGPDGSSRPLPRRARRRPNARSVLTALRKVKDLPYTTIATGHGPMLRLNLDELVQRRARLGRAGREAAVLWSRGPLVHCCRWMRFRGCSSGRGACGVWSQE